MTTHCIDWAHQAVSAHRVDECRPSPSLSLSFLLSLASPLHISGINVTHVPSQREYSCCARARGCCPDRPTERKSAWKFPRPLEALHKTSALSPTLNQPTSKQPLNLNLNLQPTSQPCARLSCSLSSPSLASLALRHPLRLPCRCSTRSATLRCAIIIISRSLALSRSLGCVLARAHNAHISLHFQQFQWTYSCPPGGFNYSYTGAALFLSQQVRSAERWTHWRNTTRELTVCVCSTDRTHHRP